MFFDKKKAKGEILDRISEKTACKKRQFSQKNLTVFLKGTRFSPSDDTPPSVTHQSVDFQFGSFFWSRETVTVKHLSVARLCPILDTNYVLYTSEITPYTQSIFAGKYFK